MRFVLLLCWLLTTWVYGADEPLAYKGLPLGASEADVLKVYPYALCVGRSESRSCFLTIEDYMRQHKLSDCPRSGSPGADECTKRWIEQRPSIAGAPVSLANFDFADGKLVSIRLTIQSSSFERISTALTDVYGRPSVDTKSPITNRAGAVFEDRETAWQLAARGSYPR